VNTRSTVDEEDQLVRLGYSAYQCQCRCDGGDGADRVVKARGDAAGRDTYEVIVR
jgi:hypothetical protein